MPTITINKILDDVRSLGCSDLHFTVGINPVVRLHGQLRKMSSYPEMTDEIVNSITERYIELYEHITGEKFQKAEDCEDVSARIEKNVGEYLKTL